MACIRTRRGSIVVDYRDATGRRRVKVCKTKEIAEKFRARVELEALARRGALVDSSISVRDYSEMWLDRIKDHLREGSWVGYDSILRDHLGLLDKVSVVDVRRPMIKELARSWKAAKSTIAKRLSILRAMFQEAIEDGLLSENPAAELVRSLRLEKVEKDVLALTADQLSRMLQVARLSVKDGYPTLLLLSHTGLRIGEGLGVMWTDLEDGRLSISRQVTPTGLVTPPKTARSTRMVDVPDTVGAVLKSHRVRQQEEALRAGEEPGPWILFPDYRAGESTSGLRSKIRTWLHNALRLADLPTTYHPHSLRHTYACIHLSEALRSPDSDVTVKYISDQLGHASIKETLDTYARAIRLSNQSVADRFGARVARAQRELF